jgi:hypothetical protein
MKAKVGPLVARLGGTLAEVDVDADPVLSGRFGREIPVLLDAEGRVVAKLRDPVERIARRLGARGGLDSERALPAPREDP